MATILLIDDDSAVLRNVSEMLRFEGYDLIVAENGAKGLDIAAERAPDLVITDIGMPGISGFDVLHALRRRESTAQVPIIFITGMKHHQVVLDQIQATGVDCVFKPFALMDMLKVVQKFLPTRAFGR